MKKIISLILSAVLVLSLLLSAPMQTLGASASGAYTDQVALLSKLGIIDSLSEVEAKEKTITRAEFVTYLGAIIGVDENTKSNVRYYIDVPMDHWAMNTINTLTDRGILSIPPDKTFRPGDKITGNEALKLLLSLTGYGEYAMAQGGYPIGYYSVAKSVGLRVTATDQPISMNNIVTLLYDAVQIPLYDVKGIVEDSVKYGSSQDTLLSRYFDIDWRRGILTEAMGLSLSGRASRDTGVIRIDGTEYQTTLNLTQKLGCEITFFYRQTKSEETPQIVLISSAENQNEVIELDSKNFNGYDGASRTISYQSNSKTERIKLAANAAVVRNGKLMDENITQAFQVNKGTIRAVDSKGDGEYESVLIFDYVNYIVDSKDSYSSTIYDAVVSGRSIELDETNTSQIVLLQNGAGQSITFDQIAIGSVLSVYQSESYLLAVMSQNEITGTVFSVDASGNEYQVQLGKNENDMTWYSVDKDYYQTAFTDRNMEIGTGTQGSFLTDCKGNIAFIKFSSSDGWTYGYLVNHLMKSGVEQVLQLKLYTQAGEMKVYNVNKKAEVNGISCNNAAAVQQAIGKDQYNKTLEKDSAGTVVEDNINGQLLRFRLNSEQKINAIDTEKSSPEQEGGQNLHRTASVQSLYYRWNAGTFNGLFARNAGTVLFGVPEHKNLSTAEEKDFVIPSASWLGDFTYKAEGFKLDESAGYESAVVIYGPEAVGRYSAVYLVEKVVDATDKDGNTVKAAYVNSVSNGTQTRLQAQAGYDFAGVGEGDIIRVRNNLKGEVFLAQMIYDYSRRSEPGYSITWNWLDTDPYTQYGNLAHGYLKSFEDGVIRLSWGRPQNSDYSAGNISRADYVAPKGSGAILIYDSTRADKKVRLGSNGDLIPANMLGSEAQPYFLYAISGVFRGAVIYQ